MSQIERPRRIARYNRLRLPEKYLARAALANPGHPLTREIHGQHCRTSQLGIRNQASRSNTNQPPYRLLLHLLRRVRGTLLLLRHARYHVSLSLDGAFVSGGRRNNAVFSLQGFLLLATATRGLSCRSL